MDEGPSLEEIIKYRQWVAEQIKDTPGLVRASVSSDGTLTLSFKHLKKFVLYANPSVYGGGYLEYNNQDMLQIKPFAGETAEIIKEREEFDKKVMGGTPL